MLIFDLLGTKTRIPQGIAGFFLPERFPEDGR
jgi:hypothetical protein